MMYQNVYLTNFTLLALGDATPIAIGTAVLGPKDQSIGFQLCWNQSYPLTADFWRIDECVEDWTVKDRAMIKADLKRAYQRSVFLLLYGAFSPEPRHG